MGNHFRLAPIDFLAAFVPGETFQFLTQKRKTLGFDLLLQLFQNILKLSNKLLLKSNKY